MSDVPHYLEAVLVEARLALQRGRQLSETTIFLEEGLRFSPISMHSHHVTFIVHEGAGLMCCGNRRVRSYGRNRGVGVNWTGFILAGQPFGIIDVRKRTEFTLIFLPASVNLRSLYRAHQLARQAVENPLTTRLLGPGPAET